MELQQSAALAKIPAKNSSPTTSNTIIHREKLTIKDWSNLAQVVYKRTYARKIEGEQTENWEETVQRVIDGNIRKYRGTNLLEKDEEQRLFYYIYNRKAMPAGRGLWFSGSEAHNRLGGAGLVNCWGTTADNIDNFVMAQDLLMLGGGVGMSVEHKYVSKLPRPKKNVVITHSLTNDADFIVPDSREGWCELLRKVLKSYFVTGKSFTYSTICIRGKGEAIKGFGGTASGPLDLVKFIEKLSVLLNTRAGKAIRPIDAADMLCLIAEMVVAGNVRRSALIIIGDCWDKLFLRAKRWDLGTIPSQRGNANFSVVCDDVEDLHPEFWKSYEHGEPFGIINRTNLQTYGRMGEEKKDTAVVVNPCAEIGLENGEPCNLTECFLPNLKNIEEFKEAARLMFRWSKRITCEDYHNPVNDKVIKKNSRVGVGITGCLQAPELFKPEVLDEVYAVIQKENTEYSKALGVPESIRTTTVKPSGTVSLVGDCTAGIHPAYSQYCIRRVTIAANDPLAGLLKEAGHHLEPKQLLDGTLDHGSLIVEFPVHYNDSTPCADNDFDTWKQLEVLKMVQKHWSDNSVSVTVYYDKDNLKEVKDWVTENLSEIKTISFLLHQGHGFPQAPWQPITEAEYNKMVASLKPLSLDHLAVADDVQVDECASGVCPIK
jgi:ribonucleoside-triphosphate reductase